MQQITVTKAKELFLEGEALFVAQEQCRIYYDFFSGESDVEYYLSHGCLVARCGEPVIWHIHALSPASDILSAYQEVVAVRKPAEQIFAFVMGEIPEDWKNCPASYRFSRAWVPFEDAAVRPVTLDDKALMEACCVVDAEESALGKMIAESFMDSFTEHVCDDSVISLLITENGNAAGFVTGDIDREMNIVTVEIFVNRRYRGKGYAKRLLSALCAAMPEVVYCYSCKKENVASMNTAKSCGFVYKGAYLLVGSN